MQQGKREEAITEYKQAVRLNPKYAIAYLSLGGIYYNQGEYDKAIAAHKTAINLNENLAAAYLSLGLAYHRQHQLDEAIVQYNKAISINPIYAPAYHYFKNQNPLAIELLQKAIILDRSGLESSKTDSDLSNIRESPEFQQLINSR